MRPESGPSYWHLQELLSSSPKIYSHLTHSLQTPYSSISYYYIRKPILCRKSKCHPVSPKRPQKPSRYTLCLYLIQSFSFLICPNPIFFFLQPSPSFIPSNNFHLRMKCPIYILPSHLQIKMPPSAINTARIPLVLTQSFLLSHLCKVYQERNSRLNYQ